MIQVVGKVGKGWADEEEKEEGIEWRGLLGLVAAALVYCAGLAGVIMVSFRIVAFCMKVDVGGIPKWSSIIHTRLHARSSTHYGALPVPYRIYSATDKRPGNKSSLCLRRRRARVHVGVNQADDQYSAWLSGVEAEME